MKCRKHKSHARCADCGAEFNVPKGFVLVPERDVALLNAAVKWAESRETR